MSRIESRMDTHSESFAANREHYDGLLKTLRERIGHSILGGHERLRTRHHQRGKILVRDRVDLLVDPGTPFLELSPLAAWGQYGNEVPGAGIVTGIGIVSGTPCVVIANDATVKGGSFFHETVKKHIRAQEIAEQNRLACIYLVDCGGAYLPEQDRVFPDRDHFGNTFYRQCNMSAAGIPQISAVFGGCTAGGPSIVKVATNEEADAETLDGAKMHTRVSGVSDHLARDEPHAIALVRDIVAERNMGRRMHCGASPSPPAYNLEEISGIVSHETLVCGTAKINPSRSAFSATMVRFSQSRP